MNVYDYTDKIKKFVCRYWDKASPGITFRSLFKFEHKITYLLHIFGAFIVKFFFIFSNAVYCSRSILLTDHFNTCCHQCVVWCLILSMLKKGSAQNCTCELHVVTRLHMFSLIFQKSSQQRLFKFVGDYFKLWCNTHTHLALIHNIYSIHKL